MLELNKIYNSDCLIGLEKLEDKKVDCIIIDPPFNSETKMVLISMNGIILTKKMLTN
jgi:DNA modification methylase